VENPCGSSGGGGLVADGAARKKGPRVERERRFFYDRKNTWSRPKHTILGCAMEDAGHRTCDA
jgi:hypothetical protein